MTTVLSQVDTHAPFDVGPVLQFPMSATLMSLASNINANSNIKSQIILTNGYKVFSFGLTSTQGGSVSIQRYLDQAAIIGQGAAVTGTITANTALIVSSTDDLPFQSMIITVTNSQGTPATLSNVLLLLQAY